MNVYSTIGERISHEIEYKGDRPNNIAAMLGCSAQAISQFRNGKAIPKMENLVTLSHYFGCSLDYLIGMSDVRSPETDIQAVCEYTGLSEQAVMALKTHNGDKRSINNVILALVGD